MMMAHYSKQVGGHVSNTSVFVENVKKTGFFNIVGKLRLSYYFHLRIFYIVFLGLFRTRVTAV